MIAIKIFMAVTVVIVLVIAFIGIAIQGPWWVTVWLLMFLGGALYVAHNGE
jgi:hypothetical protein